MSPKNWHTIISAKILKVLFLNSLGSCGHIMRYGHLLWGVLVCLVSAQYTFYGSLQSFMTCRRSAKELFLLIILLASAKRHPHPYSLPDLHYLYLLPDCYPVATRPNHISVNPPIFDAIEWMDIQTGLNISGTMKLCCWTYSLLQRLQTWTLIQR